jgi:hypothetical protein
MWARLVVAPWWARWLWSASVIALLLIAILAWGFPGFGTAGWLWPLGWIVLFSLIVTALTTAAQNPVYQSYGPAIAGLSLAERSQAVQALRRGAAPSDPRVLAAAIRIGNLSMAYQGRVPGWQRKVAWCVPALWVVAGILQFVGHNVRGGITWIGLAALIGARLAWAAYRVRRLPERLQLLRAAAESSPQALSTVAEARDPVAAPPGVKFRLASATVVLLAVVGAVVLGYLRARPSPDCRTADAVVNFIHAHPDMLDAQLITDGGPSLQEYQDWSNRLAAYARQVSAPDLAPHLQRIAQISADAVSVVADVRRDPEINQSTHELVVRQLMYQGIVGHLIDEDKALVPPCHQHG